MNRRKELRRLAIEMSRYAQAVRSVAAEEGTAREAPRAWLAVADAFEVAGDAWSEAAAAERDLHEARSMNARADDARRIVQDILRAIDLAYTPRRSIRFADKRSEWWR